MILLKTTFEVTLLMPNRKYVCHMKFPKSQELGERRKCDVAKKNKDLVSG